MIWALEDADEMHTANELQFIQNSESQTFLSGQIYMPLILNITFDMSNHFIWNYTGLIAINLYLKF